MQRTITFAETKNKPVSIDFISNDILLNCLLLRLSISDFPAVARVSKKWKSLVNTLWFISKTLSFYYPEVYRHSQIDDTSPDADKLYLSKLKRCHDGFFFNASTSRHSGMEICDPAPLVGCGSDVKRKLFSLAREGNIEELLKLRELAWFKNFSLFRMLQSMMYRVTYETPLDIIIKAHHQPILDFLYKEFYEYYQGDCKSSLEVDRHGYVTAIDPIDAPLIYWAAKFNQLQAIPFLIQNGADINASTYDRRFQRHETPLTISVQFGHKRMAKYLIENGAGPLNEAINVAAFHGHLDIFNLCLEKGVDINCVNSKATTPLHYAVMGAAHGKKTIDIVRILLAKGADANLVDGSGCTPIRYAGYHEDKEQMLEIVTLISQKIDTKRLPKMY